ncbi:hypothetical protein ASPZODRAFT_15947 [Penicilliopsis zonata CBS 506.65]|uniref:HNH domain-containing protein n=1 Tax=Penicilliopsis zonata CBS 506.65 TaxID=1073090 RepID=A0A1L9SJD0_9EURO|nr:hypothetical protein ASPZODRAFT_15947 [Penicilliopsis zonata CBS 506.65]OJJ47267.1 hypothetical protein ASPZODRAFT_15947 [Penicilliopsis zonata CBS 506.65]
MCKQNYKLNEGRTSSENAIALCATCHDWLDYDLNYFLEFKREDRVRRRLASWNGEINLRQTLSACFPSEAYRLTLLPRHHAGRSLPARMAEMQRFGPLLQDREGYSCQRICFASEL